VKNHSKALPFNHKSIKRVRKDLNTWSIVTHNRKLLDIWNERKAKGMGKNERSDQNDNKNDFLAHAVGKEIIKKISGLSICEV